MTINKHTYTKRFEMLLYTLPLCSIFQICTWKPAWHENILDKISSGKEHDEAHSLQGKRVHDHQNPRNLLQTLIHPYPVRWSMRLAGNVMLKMYLLLIFYLFIFLFLKIYLYIFIDSSIYWRKGRLSCECLRRQKYLCMKTFATTNSFLHH